MFLCMFLWSSALTLWLFTWSTKICSIEIDSKLNMTSCLSQFQLGIQCTHFQYGASCSLFPSHWCNPAWWVRAALYCDITAALLDFMLLFIKVCLFLGFIIFVGCVLLPERLMPEGKSKWKCCKWYFIRSWQNRREIGDIEMYSVGKIKMATGLPT